MNEAAAIDAVYTVIEAARTTLVTELTHSGFERVIKHLSRTNLFPPMEYYAMAIDCEAAHEYSMPGVNSITGVAWVEYNMAVQLADGASIQPEDTSPYTIVHNDFRRLRDRIVRLLRNETKWFPSATASPRFRMPVSGDGENDRRVDVDNQNFSFQDQEGVEYAMLFSRITFRLIDHCSDSSLLYPS